jgi:hypothetical protein
MSVPVGSEVIMEPAQHMNRDDILSRRTKDGLVTPVLVEVASRADLLDRGFGVQHRYPQ